MSRATQSELLDQRIAENAAAQQVDLATWIFERVRVRPGDRVLELCCGTGGQTLNMLYRVGENGHVTAVDISRSALDTLSEKAGANRHRLDCIEAGLENFISALNGERDFDIVFCAYGLYYSTDVLATLAAARSVLRREGRMVVVGPFGPNNHQLFNVVRSSGVKIGDFVIYSSETFMTQTVLPWGAQAFESVAVHTMVNPVRWVNAERVLNYWQNTTFYDAEKRSKFEELLREHFAKHSEFLNEKWVMLAEMSNVR